MLLLYGWIYVYQLLLQVLRKIGRIPTATRYRSGKTNANGGAPALIAAPPRPTTRFQPKPPWVRRDVLRLCALMPDASSRRIAECFNRQYAETKRVTVGKTWVAEQRRKHRYDILHLRRAMKHRIPRPLPRHRIWAMDITGLPDQERRSCPGALLHRHRLRQIPWLIHISPFKHRHMIRQQLQRDCVQDRRDHFVAVGHGNDG